VLWGISFTNLNMLLATIPVYESKKSGANKKDDTEVVDSIADIFKE